MAAKLKRVLLCRLVKPHFIYAIKKYKLKNPRYLGTFCVDGRQTAKIHLYMVSIYWSASLRISSV